MYWFLQFLPPIGALFAEYAEKDAWPSKQRLVSVLILATIAGIGGLRMFFDGTVQRRNEERKSIKANKTTVNETTVQQ